MEPLAESIFQQIANDKALFPNVPETALRILNAMEDPNCNNEKIAKIIQLDAGLSAFVIKSATSLRFHTRIPPKDLNSAIRTMGMRESYHLSLAFLSRSAFHTSDKQLKSHLKHAYLQSTKTAIVAFFLASQVKGFEPGQAMLAGLMQDIGVPAILAAMAKQGNFIQDEAARRQLIDQLAPRVGVFILKSLKFDQAILNVVQERNHWMREHEHEADLVDLILIARLHALIGQPAFRECPPMGILPAFQKLELGEIGPDQALMLVKNSREELQSIGQLLAA